MERVISDSKRKDRYQENCLSPPAGKKKRSQHTEELRIDCPPQPSWGAHCSSPLSAKEGLRQRPGGLDSFAPNISHYKEAGSVRRPHFYLLDHNNLQIVLKVEGQPLSPPPSPPRSSLFTSLLHTADHHRGTVHFNSRSISSLLQFRSLKAAHFVMLSTALSSYKRATW